MALYRAGRVAAVMGCGGTGRHGPSEAAVIARLCREAGLPDTAILHEDRSTRTRENLLNARDILSDLGARAVIVTDSYHAPRARLIAWQIGLSATHSTPGWRGIGPRHRLRHIPREALALLATLLRLS